MAHIVLVAAGIKGDILRMAWLRGGHTTSVIERDVSEASIIVFGGNDPHVLARAGEPADGAIVIDCGASIEDDLGGVGASRSADLARAFPSVRVVKALNALSADVLRLLTARNAPELGSVYTSAFYCGDDPDANRVVAGLLSEIGLDPVDCGPLANAAMLDYLGRLTDYLAANVFPSPFALTVARDARDRSPLDRWM